MDMEVIGGLTVHFNSPEHVFPPEKLTADSARSPFVVSPSSRLAPHATVVAQKMTGAEWTMVRG
jgi:hypothetical protein